MYHMVHDSKWQCNKNSNNWPANSRASAEEGFRLTTELIFTLLITILSKRLSNLHLVFGGFQNSDRQIHGWLDLEVVTVLPWALIKWRLTCRRWRRYKCLHVPDIYLTFPEQHVNMKKSVYYQQILLLGNSCFTNFTSVAYPTCLTSGIFTNIFTVRFIPRWKFTLANRLCPKTDRILLCPK